ncbi:MAG: amidohydrolase [Candidatus Kapabacteria bacterium]|nr:amidohydrolase [Candidatus Kapabacteria bacterium]
MPKAARSLPSNFAETQRMTTREHVESIFSWMVETRRHLHRHPEISFHEFETADYISAKLTELGIEHKRVATTGIVAHVGTGSPCVALRADIDALPMEEETGLEYASTRAGVMHACGHDMHTTMLLAAARLLKEQEHSLSGTVKLLFQPGEEKSPGGASMMIAEGALQNPTPSMVFGQHVYPDAPVGELGFVAGPMMAAADELYWTITGFGAHAAQPHQGRDPIMAASGLIHHLQTLITKRRNPLDAGVITVTSIHGGTATNIIPDVVEMKGTLRSFDQQWREQAWSFIEEQSKAYCALHGCVAEVTIVKGYPPLVNDENAVAFARNVAAKYSMTAADFEPKMWAEDFAFYTQVAPSCFWTLGARPAELDHMPGLHNPRFAPDEEAMITGATMMVRVALEALQNA